MTKKIIGIAIGISILLAGCTGTQTKVRAVSGEDRDVIIRELSAEKNTYKTYDCSSVVFFQPIGMDVEFEFVGLHCESVDQQKGIDRLRRNHYLHRVSGPEEEVLGYYAWVYKTGNIGSKFKDAKTLQFFYYPINRGR